MNNSNILYIKNMVCQRCIMAVENILIQENIAFKSVKLGEIELHVKTDNEKLQRLEKALNKIGFELIETRTNQLIEKIKLLIQNYLENINEQKKIKLSTFITLHIPYEYSYLSDLFSSVEGTTIEQYFIHLRIEKVKEFLVYNQLSLTEIAYQTGFSSVHHLSSQFKKVTGLTPGYFKQLGANKRIFLDKI